VAEAQHPRVAADVAVFAFRDGAMNVLLVRRRYEPYESYWALPAGFELEPMSGEEAAERELREETDGTGLHLEQLKAYGTPDRDPRGRVISVAFLAIMPNLPLPIAGSDASSAAWQPVDRVRGTLAFDHDRILDDAVEGARSRLEFTTLATTFCGPAFTIGDLRNVYEVVWGHKLDPRNFNRKVLNTPGFVEPTGERRTPEVGRPAALYRAAGEQALNPPLLRG